MKNLMFIGLVFFLLLSCEKNTIENELVDGIWVETTQRMDTLDFARFDNQFNLKRGSVLQNGYLLPKHSSGLYSYELKDDSISLLWMASSSLNKTLYYFKFDPEKEQIKIGNFFVDSLSNNEILTFSNAK